MDSPELLVCYVIIILWFFIIHYFTSSMLRSNYDLDYLDLCLDNWWYVVYSCSTSPVCVYSWLKFDDKEAFEKFIYYDLKLKQK